MARVPEYVSNRTLVDRKRLREIMERFSAHNRERHWRLFERLPRGHQQIVAALPILFHRNHPALPGYLKPTTPCGLPGYQPSASDIAAAKGIALSYEPDRLVAVRPELMALYLMGSAGSIGYSAHSDLDLWVCCDAHTHRRLMPKVQTIEHWARGRGLALQTYLVDPRQFREGVVTTSDTPMLLLDEFYRSAVHLAGSKPAWWLVPPEDDERHAGYVANLQQKKFVGTDEVIDFGRVGDFPEDEVYLGCLRELRQALRTPFKSLLKFMLIRSYAEMPSLPGLALAYKQHIYDGCADPLSLDTYLLLFEHLQAAHEPRGASGRQVVIRDFLVRKIARGNSQLGRNADGLRLLAQLGVSDKEARALKTPTRWRFAELVAESETVRQELGLALDFLAALDRRRAERHPDLGPLRTKVEDLTRDVHNLNPALVPRRPATRMSVEGRAGIWTVRELGKRMYDSPSLVSVALWAHRNGLNGANFHGSGAGSVAVHLWRVGREAREPGVRQRGDRARI